jgi:hypothetical protein
MAPYETYYLKRENKRPSWKKKTLFFTMEDQKARNVRVYKSDAKFRVDKQIVFPWIRFLPLPHSQYQRLLYYFHKSLNVCLLFSLHQQVQKNDNVNPKKIIQYIKSNLSWPGVSDDFEETIDTM